MKLEDKLKKLLQDEPRARERRNKVRAVSQILRKNHPVLSAVVPEVLQLIVDETIALERYWRGLLQKYPELRGQDYDGKGFKSKKQITQEKMVELEYQPDPLKEDFERALNKDE